MINNFLNFNNTILLFISLFITAYAFNSSYSSYKMFNFRTLNFNDPVFQKDNELFYRTKCKTCCKVMFVSDYNFQKNQRFINQDDKDGYIRYAMDVEFDDVRSLRDPKNYNNFYNEYNNYQQSIVLRPIDVSNDLQYFEFSEYNMYNPYRLPKRVFDIQGGVKEGRALIMYMNKWGNEDGNGVKNQQFKYVHDYNNLGYYSKINEEWVKYPYHFFLPNTTNLMLCFSAEVKEWSKKLYTNTGNKDLIPLIHDELDFNTRVDGVNKLYENRQHSKLEPAYQIISRSCNIQDAKQMFIPVYI